MSKPVVLTSRQWRAVLAVLHTEYPKSTFMLRNKMREKLGFTMREHKAFIQKPDGGYYDAQIHLDFYSDNKRTMFLLKYSEIINGK